MTAALPSIEVVPPGTLCPECLTHGLTVEIHVAGFCPVCYEAEMAVLEAAEKARQAAAAEELAA
jgi:hypothetical protein